MNETETKQTGLVHHLPEIRDGVTLVVFSAEWCTACCEQHPIVEVTAEKYRGRVQVIDLNVDDCPAPAMSLGITSIPTLIVFKDGREVYRFIGIQTGETLSGSLEKALRE